MRTTLGLEDEIGQRVFSLKSVRMEGKLEGLLLTMQVSQRYRNDTDDTIEASYTFPAGWGANLLGFSVTLNGKQMQAIALAKRQAEENYEKAISDGDTPVMLEKSPLGLYTANLGNIKPNEETVIDIEYAQLLRFEKGRIRITVPTVLALWRRKKTRPHRPAPKRPSRCLSGIPIHRAPRHLGRYCIRQRHMP